MSRLIFQAKVTLLSATDTGLDNKWDIEFAFNDNEGVFSVAEVQLGDVLVFDTGNWELGTLTRYIITDILSTTSTNFIGTVQYDPTNDNSSPNPDLNVSVFTDGVIARPSPNYSLLPVVSRDVQIISDRFSEYLQNYNFNNIVDNIVSGGATQVLNNATPTPSTLGGIPAGTTFNNVPVEIVLRDLLYPYQAPAFTAFSISGQTSPIEVGASVAGGSRTFTWTTSNSTNVSPNTVQIIDVTNGNTTILTGSANDGTQAITISAVTKTSATNHTWRIVATNTNSVNFNRDYTVIWQWRRFFGESTLTTLSEPEIEALRVSQLSTGFSGNYAFNAGGYKWIAYPVSFGTATTFKDTSTNLDVPFQPVQVISITNAFGVTTNYNVHRTTNILGAAITIAVS